MLPDDSFIDQVADGYEHLYDTVYLRTHPLTRLISADERQGRKEIAWQLHHLLLDAIDELDPGPEAPAFSREWRRHRLMVLRYCDGLTPQAVAERLSISQRSLYREQREAIEALSIILAEQHFEGSSLSARGSALGESPQVDRMSLLRMEAGRLASEQRQARLGEVVDNALNLVQDMAAQRGVSVTSRLNAPVSEASVNRNAVRQVLLEVLSYLIGRAAAGPIEISGDVEQGNIHVMARISQAGEWEGDGHDGDGHARLAYLEELAKAQGVVIAPLPNGDKHAGLYMCLPCRAPRTILVADDNEDTLQLFERYLTANGYNILTARNGAETLTLAKSCLPSAITLDIMMPEQDGWDVLPILTNQPETQHIPVIVCTVLGAKGLALSLGANLFLEKPVSEQSLLSALAALRV